MSDDDTVVNEEDLTEGDLKKIAEILESPGSRMDGNFVTVTMLDEIKKELTDSFEAKMNEMKTFMESSQAKFDSQMTEITSFFQTKVDFQIKEMGKLENKCTDVIKRLSKRVDNAQNDISRLSKELTEEKTRARGIEARLTLSAEKVIEDIIKLTTKIGNLDKKTGDLQCKVDEIVPPPPVSSTSSESEYSQLYEILTNIHNEVQERWKEVEEKHERLENKMHKIISETPTSVTPSGSANTTCPLTSLEQSKTTLNDSLPSKELPQSNKGVILHLPPLPPPNQSHTTLQVGSRPSTHPLPVQTRTEIIPPSSVQTRTIIEIVSPPLQPPPVQTHISTVIVPPSTPGLPQSNSNIVSSTRSSPLSSDSPPAFCETLNGGESSNNSTDQMLKATQTQIAAAASSDNKCFKVPPLKTRHARDWTKSSQLVCKCGMHFQNMTELTKHLRKPSNESSPNNNSRAPAKKRKFQAFTDQSSKVSVPQNVHGIKDSPGLIQPYACICTREFKFREELENHISTYSSSSSQIKSSIPATEAMDLSKVDKTKPNEMGNRKDPGTITNNSQTSKGKPVSSNNIFQMATQNELRTSPQFYGQRQQPLSMSPYFRSLKKFPIPAASDAQNGMSNYTNNAANKSRGSNGASVSYAPTLDTRKEY